MRARNHIPIRAAGAGVLAAAAVAAPAAAAPAPCGGVPQITDVAGDGHHSTTDVVSAWLSEDAGRLQAVIRPRVAVWEPAHDDSDAAGFALLYTAGGRLRYVRGRPCAALPCASTTGPGRPPAASPAPVRWPASPRRTRSSSTCPASRRAPSWRGRSS